MNPSPALYSLAVIGFSCYAGAFDWSMICSARSRISSPTVTATVNIAAGEFTVNWFTIHHLWLKPPNLASSQHYVVYLPYVETHTHRWPTATKGELEKRVVILLAGFSVHAQRWCPKKEKGAEECEEDNLYYEYYEHMCCGDLEKSNECCKAFTMFDYLITNLGFAFIFVITYAVCSINKSKEDGDGIMKRKC